MNRPEELDCLTCGACCRTGSDGRILVPAEDLVRWRRIGRSELAEQVQPGHFGELAFATRPDGACVHLGTERGGASDASHLAAGAPLLAIDGLGPLGGGSHAPDEHVVTASLLTRAEVALALVAAALQ